MYRTIVLLMLLLMCSVSHAQRFFNLTAKDVAIGEQLPVFTCAMPLGAAYADSVYTVRLLYPDFIDMSSSDIAAYHALSSEPLPELPEVRQQIVVDRRKGTLEVALCPLVYREGRYRLLVSFMLKVEAKAKKAVKRRQPVTTRVNGAADGGAALRYAANSVLATGRWAKIRVPSDGVYQLTESLARQAGFSSLSKVKIYGYGGHLQNEKLDGDELTELDDLKEVPTCTVGGRRLFYGKGPVSWRGNTSLRRTRNPYSDYGYYFLTQADDGSEPLSVDSATFVNSFYPSPYYYHSLHETDGFAWMQGGRNLFDPKAVSSGESQQIKLGGNANATQATFTVTATASARTRVEVLLNDESKGIMTITIVGEGTTDAQYSKGGEKTFSFTTTELKDDNVITLKNLGGTDMHLDFVQVTWDKPLPMPSLTSGVKTPEYVYNITNQNHHADPQADMVIIIATSQKLLKQAQRLANFHSERDGLRVNIVPADELYNEFGSGTPDANAYRRYLKMLYDRATTEADMPRYLLLFGDCVWDNRLLTSACRALSADDLLLCHESEDSYSLTKCYVDDGFFCLLDDGEGENPLTSDKLDVAVGRFPVTTEADAKTMVDKVMGYVENKNAGSWQNTLVFMGDDGNNNLHMKDQDETAEMVAERYPGFAIKKIMWDAYERVSTATGNSYPEVTRLIKQQQQQGALIMDYAGHGSERQISHEKVINATDFLQFTNANLPLWITASCDIMPYDGTTETIGENAVLNSKGGAVAFFGTTRTVYTNYNKVINQAYLRHVLNKDTDGKALTIGEAQRRAKNELIELGSDRTENKLQYALLGDPAMRLNLPSLTVSIDEINGQKVDAGNPVHLKAGSIATMSGHVEGDDTFTGVVSATVRDAEQTITCRMNDQNDKDGAQYALTFDDRTATLFQGNDSIRAGKFAFSFAVPKDLHYSDASALVNLYAVNTERTEIANGWCDKFVANGSDVADNDSIGPSIFCYLNSPSFVNGGKVNTTPYFVANIKDQDGLNASGSGIGHDMQLTIDGDMNKTYSLNDYFTFDFGSYTSGSIYYSLPELTPGKHRLQFRAWDVLNNSSTVQLDFTVVKGLQPNVFNVSVTENPASAKTTFIISHDRMGSNVDVVIELFDMSGRKLWQHEESGVSTDSAYTVDWDLTVDGGRRLQTGVYLYRARLGSDGSGMASKAKKLIIVDRQ